MISPEPLKASGDILEIVVVFLVLLLVQYIIQKKKSTEQNRMFVLYFFILLLLSLNYRELLGSCLFIFYSCSTNL